MMLLAYYGIPFRELSSSYFVVLHKFVELIVIGFRAVHFSQRYRLYICQGNMKVIDLLIVQS